MTEHEAPSPQGRAQELAKLVVDLATNVPSTGEPQAADPASRAQAIAKNAALRASALSGTLALPPGAVGVITVLPDLVGVWHIQAQMVADIAGAFGKTGFLSREQMLYCLFKHAAAQVARDLVMRTGERIFIQRGGLLLIQSAAARIGIVLTRRGVAKALSRWLPAVGAAGVAAYAYYDTQQVAKTAIDFFSHDLSWGPEATQGGDVSAMPSQD